MSIAIRRMILEIFLLFVAIFAYYAYKLKAKMNTYWQDQGVKVPKYWPLIGNALQVHPENLFLRKRNVYDIAVEQYKEMDGEPYYGTYFTGDPSLVIKDPELFKQLLVKDFHFLVDRLGTGVKDVLRNGNFTDQIWSKQMTMADSDDWKDLRSTFSPIFTSGKMKAMVTFIEEVRKKLITQFKCLAEEDCEFELKELLSKFSMDTIASCAFGVDAKSFDGESPFVLNASNMFKRGLADLPAFMLLIIPGGSWLIKHFKIPVIKPNETKFFVEIVKQTLKQRAESNTRRNDLVDMMMDAMKNVNVEQAEDDSEDQYDKDATFHHKSSKQFDEDITLVATAMVMLVAGYDTTGTTMSYLCFELARNPDIQKRLQEDIDQVIEENNGNLPDYYGIQNIEYLDMVFHETLRRYTPIPILQRATVANYTIPNTNIKMKTGMEIFFNIAGVHNDPKHFSDPETFNPEHFSQDAKASRHPYAYAPFGHGPRNCIGMRFAMLEAKMAIVALLAKYELCVSDKTIKGKVELDPASGLSAPKDGLWIKVRERV